jgi:hypothetical protein
MMEDDSPRTDELDDDVDEFQFQIKDEIKAARNSATQAYTQYVEEPKMSQRRYRLELELEEGEAWQLRRIQKYTTSPMLIGYRRSSTTDVSGATPRSCGVTLPVQPSG